MNKKLLIAVVSLLCLVMTGSVIFMTLAMADDQVNAGLNPSLQELADETPTFNTSMPLYIYDFTLGEWQYSFSNESGMTHTFTEGEYITFSASANDPYIWIQSPDVLPSQVNYISVMHRGENLTNKTFEIYFTYPGSGTMGSRGTFFSFPLTSTGNWASAGSECPLWSGLDETVPFDVFRFDPMASGAVSGSSIDIQYIALFASKEDADNFNFEQYKAKLAYEAPTRAPAAQPSEPEVEDNGNVSVNTNGLDLSDGTLRYTTSADGSKVTISYEINGQRHFYTVPNKKNFTSGGFAATDDLDRSFYDANEVGLYGSNGERYTGLFYFLWMGEEGDSGVFDLQKIIDEYGEDAGDATIGAYGPNGAHHFFAEPLYGYYYSKDAWVMRKHAELLCNINIDFLYFDVTNGVTYLSNAQRLMAVLHELNEAGYDAPQIVFYTNSNAAGVVQQIYNSIYAREIYPDTWFCIDGKPVIIAPESANINDFFCTKENQWPNEASKTNGWPWMDFNWPARVFYDNDGDDGAISVSIAQHCGSVRFSSSSLYNDSSNRGRSFSPEAGSTFEYGGRKSREYSKSLTLSYNTWKNDESITNQGLNFQAQFDHAIASDAKYVLVTGWNEWVAQKQNPLEHGMPANYIFFVDTASMEFSRDAEMMRGGYFDNYYIQLAYNVQKLNGAAPIIVQDARKPIDVSGSFSQWNDVLVSYSDPANDTVARNCQGFGRQLYTNNTGRNDIISSKVLTDSQNIYFYVETSSNITAFDTSSSWMQLYINTDRETTGWYGYDYIVNYAAKDASTTTVAKYSGRNGAYSFRNIGDVSYRVSGNKMMIAVPLAMLGIEGYKEINVEFKWADSTTQYDEMEDFYIDGDAAPLGRLNYIYQNYIPGVSEITYPNQQPDTEVETEIESEIETEIETEAETAVDEAETGAEMDTEIGSSAETQAELESNADAETQVNEDSEISAETNESEMDTIDENQATAEIETVADGDATQEGDTDASETSATQETLAESQAETHVVESDGCVSAMGTVSVMAIMSLISLGAVCLRKKD